MTFIHIHAKDGRKYLRPEDIAELTILNPEDPGEEPDTLSILLNSNISTIIEFSHPGLLKQAVFDLTGDATILPLPTKEPSHG